VLVPIGDVALMLKKKEAANRGDLYVPSPFAIARSTSDARTVRCSASRANNSLFSWLVARLLISAHSAASERSFSKCACMSFMKRILVHTAQERRS
jgi:hypothetical protein